ncbi:hypothetical protein [uncultured Empedobacter sp.]|uniref:hypothetical protein n=1 Tax=uncultured Empedobacter sp. TaxID=410844 RepID=UPI0025EC49DA|nr:hypothetical protein [uncultured Empedobacter sp.]
MAEDKIAEKTQKTAKTEKFKVKKDFTFDKPYKVGNTIELSDKKIIDKLTSNKFI